MKDGTSAVKYLVRGNTMDELKKEARDTGCGYKRRMEWGRHTVLIRCFEKLEGERKGQPWVIFFFNLFLLAEGSGCREGRGD